MSARVDTGVWRDLRLAVSQLTILPVGGAWPQDRVPGVAAFYPAVGLLLGVDAAVTLLLVGWASANWGDGGFVARAALPLAALVVASWAVETRFLHWDGLGDVADAAWGARDRSRRLEILADSHAGVFAVAAIVLCATVQVTGLAAVLSRPDTLGATLVAAPALARASATLAAWLGTPMRTGGLGSAVIGRPDATGIVVGCLTVGGALGGVVALHGVPGALWSAIALATAAVVPHALARALDGVNGDVMGAGIVITETVLFVTAGLVTFW